MSAHGNSKNWRNIIVGTVAIAIAALIYLPRIMNGTGGFPFSRPTPSAEVQKFDARLKELLEKGAQIVERQMAGEDVGDENVAVFNEMVALAEKAGNTAGAQDAKYLTALAAGMSDLSPKVRAYNALLREVLPVLDYTDLKSKEEIARRKEILVRYDAANTALREAFKQMPLTIEANFRAKGVSEVRIRKFIDDPSRRATAEAVDQIRLAEQEGIVLFQAQFELLQTHWGKWRYDTEGMIEFDGDDVAAQFDANAAKAAGIAERQEAHQRTLVNSMRNQARKCCNPPASATASTSTALNSAHSECISDAFEIIHRRHRGLAWNRRCRDVPASA